MTKRFGNMSETQIYNYIENQRTSRGFRQFQVHCLNKGIGLVTLDDKGDIVLASNYQQEKVKRLIKLGYDLMESIELAELLVGGDIELYAEIHPPS